VVRVGAEGSHGDGAFSTGRGGMYYIQLSFTISITIFQTKEKKTPEPHLTLSHSHIIGRARQRGTRKVS
jgi:hypothetical protein